MKNFAHHQQHRHPVSAAFFFTSTDVDAFSLLYSTLLYLAGKHVWFSVIYETFIERSRNNRDTITARPRSDHGIITAQSLFD